MTALPEPGRLPSDCPRSCDRSGPIGACCYTCAASIQHPCCLPRAGPRPVKSVVVASNYSARLGSPCGAPPDREEDASPRLLQPTYDTSTLRIDRFSSAPTRRPRGPRSNAIRRGRSHVGRLEWSFA